MYSWKKGKAFVNGWLASHRTRVSNVGFYLHTATLDGDNIWDDVLELACDVYSCCALGELNLSESSEQNRGTPSVAVLCVAVVCV